MRHAVYIVVEEAEDHVTIKDVGPWDRSPTVTNDVEFVVEEMARSGLGGRKLYCIDSEGELDELLVKRGMFAGFAPGPRTTPIKKGNVTPRRTEIVEAKED